MSNTDLYPQFFDLVSNVRAMRKLKPDPVPQELIMQVLDAGVQAPSGQNLQPWKFVLLQDPEAKKWFADHYADAMDSRFKFYRDIEQRAERYQGRELRGQLGALFHQIDHMHEAPYLLLICGQRDWPFKSRRTRSSWLGTAKLRCSLPLCAEHITGLSLGRFGSSVNHHASSVRRRAARTFRHPPGLRRCGDHADWLANR